MTEITIKLPPEQVEVSLVDLVRLVLDMNAGIGFKEPIYIHPETGRLCVLAKK